MQMTKKKKNTNIDWLFDEYGNLIKRPIGREKPKQNPFKYHIIETHDEVEDDVENED